MKCRGAYWVLPGILLVFSFCSAFADTAKGEDTTSPGLGAATSNIEAVVGSNLKVKAGSGNSGRTNGVLDASTFHLPAGIWATSDGQLIVADTNNHLIRKLDDKRVSLVAGFSTNTSAWDDPGYVDKDAFTSKFNEPRGIVVSSEGTVFIADSGNNVVRQIKGQTVYTFSGSGQAGLLDGDRKEAKFHKPVGLAITGENTLYVADCLNHAIRKINAEGEVETLGGGPEEGYRDGALSEARFNQPSALALDEKNGRLFVADSGNHVIRVINLNAGTVATYAGVKASDDQEQSISSGYKDGPGSQALFNAPKGLALTDDGFLLVADSWNQAIRVITPDGLTVSTIIDARLSETLNTPMSIAWLKGILYITDTWNNQIKELPLDSKTLEGTIVN